MFLKYQQNCVRRVKIWPQFYRLLNVHPPPSVVIVHNTVLFAPGVGKIVYTPSRIIGRCFLMSAQSLC